MGILDIFKKKAQAPGGEDGRDCLNFISKSALSQKKEIFVTDDEGTRIFDVKGNMETIKP